MCFYQRQAPPVQRPQRTPTMHGRSGGMWVGRGGACWFQSVTAANWITACFSAVADSRLMWFLQLPKINWSGLIHSPQKEKDREEEEEGGGGDGGVVWLCFGSLDLRCLIEGNGQMVWFCQLILAVVPESGITRSVCFGSVQKNAVEAECVCLCMCLWQTPFKSVTRKSERERVVVRKRKDNKGEKYHEGKKKGKDDT